MSAAVEKIEEVGFEAVHVDPHFIIAVKPSGVLAVPGRGENLQDCLYARVRQRHADALVVHRLDMSTSGLIVFARGAEAQRRLNRAFAAREVEKTYVAVVDGSVADESGRIDLPLQADWPNRPKQKVDRLHGKPCTTFFRVLSRDHAGATTRLELRPVTGRAHQLRVHLLALGHPILGDALYAPPAVLGRADRLLLHAQALAFAHPLTGAALRFAAAAPF